MGEALGHRLRAAWPHKIASDRWVDDKTVYKINLKTPTFGGKSSIILFPPWSNDFAWLEFMLAPTTDKHLFMSYALQEIRALGYEFVVSVPLAKRGPMGMGSRREVLVFKDRQFSGSRPGSRRDNRQPWWLGFDYLGFFPSLDEVLKGSSCSMWLVWHSELVIQWLGFVGLDFHRKGTHLQGLGRVFMGTKYVCYALDDFRGVWLYGYNDTVMCVLSLSQLFQTDHLQFQFHFTYQCWLGAFTFWYR